MKAIIPIAGYGTRFLPASKSIPKEMVTIVDRPIIDYVVTEAIKTSIYSGDKIDIVESENRIFDCGSKLGFVKANIAFSLNDADISSQIKSFIGEL